MDKATFLYMAVEAFLFCVPLITLFVKVGKFVERIDRLEHQIDKYETIDNRLTEIQTKLDLLLEGRIKEKT